MSYKLIVLNLDDEDTIEPLVQMAAALGEDFKTHIIGIHSLPLAAQTISMDYYLPADIYEKLNMSKADGVNNAF